MSDTISIAPPSLLTLFLLEECKHPVFLGQSEISALQIAQLVFIASQPEAAMEAVQHSVQKLNLAAFHFCRPHDLPVIRAAVQETIHRFSEMNKASQAPRAESFAPSVPATAPGISNK